MSEKYKKILKILVFMILGCLLVIYLMFKAGEYLFKTEVVNVEAVAGIKDNNPYGIRNDVYDVIQKEYVEKMNLNEEQKVVAYNIAYIDQKLLESYYSESEVIKYLNLFSLLMECKYDKYGKLIGDMIRDGRPYDKQTTNTQDRQLAQLITDRIASKNFTKLRLKDLDLTKCYIFDSLVKDQGY